MATTRKKSPAVTVSVPDGIEAAASYVRRLGDLSRQQALRKAELDGKIAALQDEYAPVLLDLAKRAEDLHKGIQIWAEANRRALTQDGKVKTANLVTGEIAWRNRPPSVSVSKLEDVLCALHTLQLGDYIRTSEEVNKEAILALDAAVAQITTEDLAQDTDAARAKARQKLHAELLRSVKGLSIKKGVEDFTVTAFETEEAAAIT